jgi:hypothetical protein
LHGLPFNADDDVAPFPHAQARADGIAAVGKEPLIGVVLEHADVRARCDVGA